jgi:hypothetical protein
MLPQAMLSQVTDLLEVMSSSIFTLTAFAPVSVSVEALAIHGFYTVLCTNIMLCNILEE